MNRRPVIAALGRLAARPWFRAAILLALLVVAVFSLVGQWPDVWPKVRAMNPWAVTAALFLASAPSLAGAFQWRLLLKAIDVAPPLRAAIPASCVGQLGKYVPGSVWPVVFQGELVRPYGVKRDRSAIAGFLGMAMMLAAAAVIAAAVLTSSKSLPASAKVPLGLVALAALYCLRPSVLTRIVEFLLRTFKRDPLSKAFTPRTVVSAFSLALVAIGGLGLHAFILARQFGSVSVATAVGGFLLAWAAGFLVPFLPAGGGVRETILYVTLGPSIGRSGALAMAAVSRVLLLVVDLTVGSIAAVSRHFITVPEPAAAAEVADTGRPLSVAERPGP